MLRACPRALCSVSRGAPRHAPLTPLAAPRFFHINSARSKPEGGLVTKMYNKVFAGGLPKSKLKASGYILETHCSQAVDLRAFLAELEMPDTFYSWFLVTELHLWLLGVREAPHPPGQAHGRGGRRQDGQEQHGGGPLGGL